MQASLRSHHHHQQQQQQQGIQQYYDYQNCDPIDAPPYEATISGAEQQAGFEQPVYQDTQQHPGAPCGNIYQTNTSVYYDLSQNYGNNTGQSLADEVGQHHQHHLKVIELQETYHQQQHYVVSEPVLSQGHQNGTNYSNTAIYADSFAQTNCVPHDANYNQDYLAQPSSLYYATVGAGDENTAQDHQCYQAGQPAALSYYEAPRQLSTLAGGENCSEPQQVEAGCVSLYQSSQINYQQLEEARKEHEQQASSMGVHQNMRLTEQPHQESSQRNSFSSALSTSSSCLSANSTAKLFSNDDEDASYDDDESEDSTLPRDQKKAKEANIPLSYNEIVNLSIDQFNEHIALFQYSEAQLTLMKDIRRRGKNKVAAQTCRKRKMEQIMELQHEVGQLANKRMALSCDLNRLVQEHIRQANEYERLYSIIQMHMSSKPTQQGPSSEKSAELAFNATTLVPPPTTI